MNTRPNHGQDVSICVSRTFLYVRLVLFAGAIAAFACASTALAQTAATGAVGGTVTDSSGAAVAGARIQVIDEATGEVHEATSQGNGEYLAPLLKPGSYRVEVSKDGFKTFARTGVHVVVTETQKADFALTVGALTEHVSVHADAEILQTENAALGNVTDDRMIEALPLVTRNYTQILGLSPGVSSDVNDAADLGAGTPLYSSHGEVDTDNNFQMNGSGVNDLMFGSIELPIPNPDSIEEFKVQTGEYDASFGRNAGANVDVVTKGGGNEFHGTAFEFVRNDDFNANDFFLNAAGSPRGVLKQNQFGGTLGGPVIKDKLFFFTSYQGTRQRNGLDTTCLGAYFTPTQITDDASSRTAAALGAAFAGQPGILGPGVAVNGSNIAPQALALLNTTLPNGGYLIPAPQNPDGSSAVSIPCPYSEDQFLTNADFAQSDRSKWAVRFFWADDELANNFSTNAGTGGGNVPGFPTTVNSRFRDFTISNTFSFEPNLVNQVVLGYARSVRLEVAQQPDVSVNGGATGPLTLTSLGVMSPPANDNIDPSVAVLGGFAIGGNGQGFDTFLNNYSVDDSLSYVHGRHSLHFGGGISRQEINFENFTFPGLIVFADMADFLTGNPYLLADLQGLLGRSWRATNGNLFAQDNIQVTKHLTLYAGLRYERDGVIGDALGRSSNYNQALLNPNPPAGGTLQGVQVASNYSGTLPTGVTRAATSAAINGDGQNRYGPRLGYAYKLPWSDRFVIRGGYGMYFARSTGQLFLQLVAVPPFSQFRVALPAFGSTFADPFAPAPTFPNFAPLTYSPSTTFAPQIFSPYYQPSVLQEYSTNLQTELSHNLDLEIGYDGVRGTKLAEERAFNQALDATVTPIRGQTVNTLANLALRTPYEGFANSATELQTAGSLWYNALDVSLRKRFSHGLEFLAAYTWARSLTDASGYSTASGQGANLIGNQNDPRSRWGPDGFVRPQRIVLSYVYNIPGPKNQFSALGRTAGGWSVSGVTTIQSGHRLNLTIVDPDNAFGINGAGLNALPAQIVSGCRASQLVTSGSVESKIGNYFNQSCFTTPPVITSDGGTAFGNAGAGIVAGPDEVNFDFAIVKRTPLGSSEARNLEFRAEFFNLFNHPQFGDPTTLSESPTFGVITDTVVSPRVIQLALKLNF